MILNLLFCPVKQFLIVRWISIFDLYLKDFGTSSLLYLFCNCAGIAAIRKISHQDFRGAFCLLRDSFSSYEG